MINDAHNAPNRPKLLWKAERTDAIAQDISESD